MNFINNISDGIKHAEYDYLCIRTRPRDYMHVRNLFLVFGFRTLSKGMKRLNQCARSHCAFLWLSCLLFATSSFAAPGVFQQPATSDGTVVMEAEHYTGRAASFDGYQWGEVASPAGFVGGSAMLIPAAASSNPPVSYVVDNARIDFQVNFNQTGKHYVWIRGYAADGKSDTVHVGLDGVAQLSGEKLRITPTVGWMWSGVQLGTGARITVNVDTVGVHTLNVWMRESGALVDRVMVTRTSSVTPTGDGPVESAFIASPTTVATPVINPAGGHFLTGTQVSLSSATSGASIYYTVNGAVPNGTSTLYSGPFDVTSNTTVRAIAKLSGYSDSSVATADFTVGNLPPQLNGIGNQTVSAGDTLTLQIKASDVDSGTPQLSATGLPANATFIDLGNGTGNFSWPVSALNVGVTSITFVATDALNSAIKTSETISVTVSAQAGNDGVFQQTATSDGTVVVEAEHYTGRSVAYDGYDWSEVTSPSGYVGSGAMQTPAAASTTFPVSYVANAARMDFRVNFKQTGKHYVWVRGFAADGKSDTLHVGLDGVAQTTGEKLRITPTVGWMWSSVQLGTGTRITLNVDTVGEHTLNLWMRESGAVVDRVMLTRTSTLSPSGNGPVESEFVGSQASAAAPVINPAGGHFLSSAQVSMTTATAGASIYYTLDDNEPTSASTRYSAPFMITKDTVVKAKAIKSGYLDSTVSVAEYSIGNIPPVLEPIGNQTVSVGDTLNLTIRASDVDSGTPVLSVSGKPAGATFVDQGNGTGSFSWPVSNANVGVSSITFKATDAINSAISTSETITVKVTTVSNSGGVFQQPATTDGTVVMEAEHFSNRGISYDGFQWGQVTTPTGFVGAGAMLAPVSASTTYPVSYTANSARMDYEISFTQSGKYYIWVRGYAADGASDTLHVGLDGVAQTTGEKLRITPAVGWMWSSSQLSTGARITLNVGSAGVHTLNVWMRESGALVDRIIVTKSSSYKPTGSGDAESGRVATPDIETLPGISNYWQFNDVSSTYFWNRTGGVATCSNCPTKVTGVVGGGLEFDGVGNQLSYPYDSSFDWAADASFTIEFWIKAGSNCLSTEAAVSRVNATTGMQWWVGCKNNHATFSLVAPGGTVRADLEGVTSLNDGKWHHIAAVRDASTNQQLLFLDGNLEKMKKVVFTSGFTSESGLTIGGAVSGSASSFQGSLDELAFHDRAMTRSSLRQHYLDGQTGLRRGFWGCNSKIKIMPLGDSNTRGNGSIPRYSYRPYLFRNYSQSGLDVDFVGSLTDTYNVGFAFDHSHEGHSGMTPAQIATNAMNWLTASAPDMVLLHIGTNQLSVPDVADILNVVDSYSPNVVVVLARIINQQPYNAAVTQFNIDLEAMARARTNDRIIMVDMEPALNYVDDMSDSLHANNAGYDKMATKWYSVTGDVLPACLPTAPLALSGPPSTASQGASLNSFVDYVGFPEPTFRLQNAPAGMTIGAGTGMISWTPATTGTFTFNVITENSNGTDTRAFTVTVK